MSMYKAIICLLDALFQAFAAAIIVSKQAGTTDFKYKIKFFCLMYIYLVICYMFIPNQLRFIFYIFICSLVIHLSFKINDKKIFLYSFISEGIFTLSEIIISLFLVMIGLNSVDIVNNSFYNLLANFLISLFSIIIINISFIYNLIKKLISLLDENRRFMKYFYVFVFVLYILLLKNGFEFLMKSNYYINILFLGSTMGIFLMIIKAELKYEQISEKNKQMLNYVTKYEKIITEQGKANHEFKNQLMVIRGYAQMNSSKLIEYLDSIAEDIKKTHSSYLISNLNKFPDGGIKGLLYYKLSVMDDEKIKYEINVSDGIKSKLNHLSTSEYKNITKILGVLLDNAIDAVKECKNKKVIIMVKKESKSVDFKLYNTYNDKIDISKLGTGYTTKGNGHGYGLRLINDIISSNLKFSIERYLEDDYYVSVLHIKNNKKN